MVTTDPQGSAQPLTGPALDETTARLERALRELRRASLLYRVRVWFRVRGRPRLRAVGKVDERRASRTSG